MILGQGWLIFSTGKVDIFSRGKVGTVLIFSSQSIASSQWSTVIFLTRLPTMLTSPEIQFGPFTWCLEATPQGVDEDRLVVGGESLLNTILVLMLTMMMVAMMQCLRVSMKIAWWWEILEMAIYDD